MMSALREGFLWVFYKVMPANLLEHQPHDVRLRSYILVGILLTCISLTFLAYLLACFLAGFSANPLVTGGVMTAFCMFSYAFALRMFVQTGSFVIAGNVAATAAFVTIVGCTVFSGGHLSPLSILLLQLPVFVFLMSGRVAGLIWLVIAFVTKLFFYYLHIKGVQLPENFIAPSLSVYVQVFSWLNLYVSIFAGLIVYDSVNRALSVRLEKERNHFEYQAAHDMLTGLANRATFERRLEETIERCQFQQSRSVLALIDLDDFKPINDQHGHVVGDEVLKAVASRLKNSIRNTDTAARVGGDEFAVILEGIDDDEVVNRTISKIVEHVSEPIRSKEQVSVTCSVGVVFCPDHGTDVDTLTHHADEMMYAAKVDKNRFIVRPV